jgi:tetratricopeptide (TPR) repeat protein
MRVRTLILPTLAVSVLGACRSGGKLDPQQLDQDTHLAGDLAFQVEPGGAEPAQIPASGDDSETIVAVPLEASSSGTSASQPQEGLGEIQLRAQRREFLAGKLVEAGDKEFAQGNLEQALKHYADALDVDPTLPAAKSGWSRTQAALGDRYQGAAEFFQDALARQSVQRAQARVAADEQSGLGDQALRAGNYAAAVDHYREALVILRFHPLIASESLDQKLLQGKLQEASRLLDESKGQAQAKAAAEAQSEQQKREQERVEYRKDKLTRLWQESNQAFMADDFAMAEALAQQILLEDAGNPAATAMRDAAAAARHMAFNERTRRDYREQWRQTFDELNTLDVPQTDVLEFDMKAWAEVSARQPLEFSTTAGEIEGAERAAVIERLDRVRFAPKFVGADGGGSQLADIASYLQNLTGVNFLVSAKVNDELGDEEKTIKLDLPERSVRTVLDLIQETSENLRWKVENGVVMFVTKEEMTGGQVLRMFDVRDIIRPIRDFPGPEINILPSDGLPDEATSEELEERAGLVVTGEALDQLIRDNIARESWNEDPKNSVRITPQGTMVVYQKPEVIEQIKDLLDDLREATGIMVDIQARFLKVEDNFLEDIGIDFRGLGQPGLGTNSFLNDFGDPATQSDLGKEIGQGTDLGAFYDEGGDGDIKGRVENLYDTALGDTDVLTGAGGLSFQWAYLNDLQLEMVLRAVSKSERMEIVTAPRLTVFNTARSNLAVLNQVAYVQDFDVEIAQAASIADPIVKVIPEGVVLDVRPVVSADRRFILMELRPTVAVLKRPILNQATTLGSQNSVTIQLPEVDLQRVRTTVPMPDGGTVMLGGLKVSEKQDLRSGVPILNKVPVVRFLFERKGKYVSNRKLLILIKANIVISSEIEPEESQLGLR